MKHLQTLIPGRFLSTTVLLVIGNYGWFPEGCFDIHSKSRTQNITRSGVEGNYQYKNSMFVNLKHVN